MSRRANGHLRCAICRMPGRLCVCSLLPRLTTRTRVVLVMHRYEERKPTNTGQLAVRCLARGEVVVRGHPGEPGSRLAFGNTRPLLLFPHPDALPIGLFAASPEPVTLVVPDGSWRQASKVRKRVPGLAGIPCVTLPPGAPSEYRLRAETRAEGLATLEAIARALRILEGERGDAVHDALQAVLRAMVERTMHTRMAGGAGAFGVVARESAPCTVAVTDDDGGDAVPAEPG